MEVKDLRIGNYISPLGIGVTKVEGFCIWDNLIQSSDFAERGIEDFEPIQLNEEWLLKFGFKYNNPTYEWYDKSAVFFIQVNYLGFDLIAKFHNQVIREIKYVHELQNLYFALTGKELAKV